MAMYTRCCDKIQEIGTQCANCLQLVRSDKSAPQRVVSFDIGRNKPDRQNQNGKTFHNGLNEWIPRDSTKRHIEERHRQKGLVCTWG